MLTAATQHVGFRWFSFCFLVLYKFYIMSSIRLCTFFKGQSGGNWACGCRWATAGSVASQVLTRLSLIVQGSKAGLPSLSWKIPGRHNLVTQHRQFREVWSNSRKPSGHIRGLRAPLFFPLEREKAHGAGALQSLARCLQGKPFLAVIPPSR